MTASLVAGWSLLVYTLGRWSSLGYLEGVIAGPYPQLSSSNSVRSQLTERGPIPRGCAATGLYALAFGLLGLIPAPRVRRS